MTGFEGIGDFDSDDPWQRYIAHQAAKGNYPSPRLEVRLEEYEHDKARQEEMEKEISAPRCPNCHRVMSNREYEEQRCCNDCYDGTIPWQT